MTNLPSALPQLILKTPSPEQVSMWPQTDAHHAEGTASRAGGEESRKPDLPAQGNYQWSHSRRAYHRVSQCRFPPHQQSHKFSREEKLGLHMEKDFPDFVFFKPQKLFRACFINDEAEMRNKASSTSLFLAKPSPETIP